MGRKFRAGPDTGAAADTTIRIDHGMERCRFGHPSLDGSIPHRTILSMLLTLLTEVDPPDNEQGSQVKPRY